MLQCLECVVGILVYACTYACTVCCAYRAVSLVQLYRGPGDGGESAAEEWGEEEIGVACLDGLYLHAHSRHYLHAVGEGECYALLCRTQHVGLGVDIEVYAVDARSWILVLQYALRSVAEWYDAQSACAYWDALGEVVHISV